MVALSEKKLEVKINKMLKFHLLWTGRLNHLAILVKEFEYAEMYFNKAIDKCAQGKTWTQSHHVIHGVID